MSNATPPGWYPDAQVPGQNRYWDGQQWTSHTAPAPDGVAVPPVQTGDGVATDPKNKNWFVRHKVLTGVIALIAIVGISGAISGDGEDPLATDSPAAVGEKGDSADPTTDAAAVSEPEAEPEAEDSDGDGVADDDDARPEDPKVQTVDDIDTDGDGVADYRDDFPKDAKFSKDTDGDGVADKLDDFPEDPEFSKDTDGDKVADAEDAFPRDPSKSEITLAMENALESAENYLSFSAFSRLGLIEQLSSEYGEGFEVADATWAVDHLRVNWNEQAVKSAKDYLEFSSFSRQGLIEQLSSAYGDQFTVAQATYAVNKIGL